MNDQAKPIISFDDFSKLDLRIAKITAVSDHPNADKLIVLDIDLGTEQRKIIAGLKPYCQPESLVGKNVVVVTNLQPRKMRGLESNAMLLAASYMEGDERKVVVITPDDQIPPGAEVS
ncbi:MAG: methionine--tRNA ligase subunit beta [Planctomycetota bacterium]|nr:methionine--tRNA ligase subunit beta [Planctomycetota bacterium]